MQLFEANELPGPRERDGYLEEISRHVVECAQYAIDDILATFLQIDVSAATFHISGLHHIGLYAGDYVGDQEIDDWIEYLRASDAVSDVSFGPSYVAPRCYGTPGYWINCCINGAAVELFSCRRFGHWAEIPRTERIKLMSHFALAVEDVSHVTPLLAYFSHYEWVRLLAVSTCDEAGHTYGHLKNERTGRVIELVSSGRVPSVTKG